jgi:hypothetical protein
LLTFWRLAKSKAPVGARNDDLLCLVFYRCKFFHQERSAATQAAGDVLDFFFSKTD